MTGNADQELQAHHAAWTTGYIVGDIKATHERTLAGSGLYRIDAHGEHAFRYGAHDPGVCAASHGALSQWLLGCPDRALATWRDGMELARRLEHPPTLGVARTLGAILFQFRREPEALLEICRESKSTPAHMKAMLRAFRGWATCMQEGGEDGLYECERAVADYRGLGASARLSTIEYLLADALRASGRADAALVAINRALENVTDRATEPELVRLKGEILLEAGDGEGHAEAILLGALEMARAADSLGWELRIATTLARSRRARGQANDAHAELLRSYDRFTEGFDTVDLIEARQVLDSFA